MHLHGILTAGRPIRLFRLISQWHCYLVASQVCSHVSAVSQIVKLIVTHLFVIQRDGSLVDTVVDGVVFQCHLLHLLPVSGNPRALFRVLMESERVGEVNHFAHLAVLEQCGIALCADALYLPLHGRQHHLVFSRLHVGPYLDVVARGVHARLVSVFVVVRLMRKHGVALAQ